MDYYFGALLAQKNELGHEQAIYYLSRMIIVVKHRYVEKKCLALVFVV